MSLTQAERAERARMGGLTTSARASSGAAMTAAARAGFSRKFWDQTDESLPDAERARQAQALLKLHMIALARKGRGKPKPGRRPATATPGKAPGAGPLGD